MEEKTTNSSIQHTSQRESNHTQKASTPTLSTDKRTSPLASSEPTLRFPRPVGSRHLANWISSSDPDIMRLTTPSEDTGLSESTYELVSGTDSESQDGAYTESMGGSVGSLENYRPEETYSFVNAEHVFEDEAAHDEVASQQPEHLEGHTAQAGFTVNDSNRTDASDSEDDGHSERSIDYAQQSLSTPSIPTPEASKILDIKPRRRQAQGIGELLEQAYIWFQDTRKYVQEISVKLILQTYPGDIPIMVLASTLLAFAVCHLLVPNLPVTPSAPAESPIPTILAPSTTLSSQTSLLRPDVPTSSVDLVPRENALTDDWLLGAKKPVVSFTPQSHGNVLVQVPDEVMQRWLSKGCLIVSATRDDHHIDTIMSTVDEGLLLKFARQDAHGVVNVSLQSTCRPKVNKVVKVQFGKTANEEAFEMLQRWAQDVAELVPVVRKEAERFVSEKAQAIESVANDMLNNLVPASKDAVKGLEESWLEFHQSLSPLKSKILNQAGVLRKDIKTKLNVYTQEAKQAAHQLPDLRDVQSRAQIKFLDAQLSARIWWLKVTGREKEHDEYRCKAQDFIAKAEADAAKERRQRHASTEPGKSVWRKRARSCWCRCKSTSWSEK